MTYTCGKARSISHWLLILKPGQCMELHPETFGVKGETIQAYVQNISRAANRRYKVSGGENTVNKLRAHRDQDKPVVVRYLGDK